MTAPTVVSAVDEEELTEVMRWWLVSATSLVLGALVLAAGDVWAAELGVDLSTLLRDADPAAESPWYAGSLSVVTTMVWAGTSAAGLVLAVVRSRKRWALACLGVLAAFLALDDAFRLHEVILPAAFSVPEVAPTGVYAVAAVSVLVLLHRSSSPARWPLLLAGTLLAVSAAVDLLVPFTRASSVVEDSFKLLGALQLLSVPVVVSSQLGVRAPVHAPR